MRNSYTTPEVFELGRAKEQILGVKPMSMEMDAVLGWFFRTEPLETDIDECDD